MSQQRILRSDECPVAGVHANEDAERLGPRDCVEIELGRGDVSICLLLNRRTRVMRIIDFRAGAQDNKFDLISEAAARYGVLRAFTIAEKEESNTWAKMGFEKEASIPGFYKRSDGYILGMEFDPSAPHESGTRIRIRKDEGTKAVPSESDRAERSYQAARLLARSCEESSTKVNISPARTKDADKAFATATQSGRILTRMEPFGRGTERSSYLCTARGGFSLLVGVEPQPCFDNAFIEVLSAPRGEKEAWLTAVSLERICAELLERDICSVFALSPAESVELSAAWLKAGFRRTGRLASHLEVHGRRTDAFLWSRRLGEPG